jgi:hypothetical protein
LIAATGSGRSITTIPAGPAAWSLTTIALTVRRLLCQVSVAEML